MDDLKFTLIVLAISLIALIICLIGLILIDSIIIKEVRKEIEELKRKDKRKC